MMVRKLTDYRHTCPNVPYIPRLNKTTRKRLGREEKTSLPSGDRCKHQTD